MTEMATGTSPPLFGVIPIKYGNHFKAAGVIIFSVFCAAPVKVLSTMWHVVWTSIGVTLGVGMGFGLAMHVYDQLQEWHKANELQKYTVRGKSSIETIRPKVASRQASNMLEDGASYVSLMASAGYPVDDKVLRGQVLRDDAPFWDVKYRFTDVKIEEQKGPQFLQEDWPSLPAPVTRELGRFIEHLMRDYISGWYCKLDGGCLFRDEKEKRKEGIPRDGGEPETRNREPTGGKSNAKGESKPDEQDEKTRETEGKDRPSKQSAEASNNFSRRMVFSTLTHRRTPMLDQTYRVLSAAFGNLATRAEHVNILSLALLKWTQVVAHTFKVYRTLRKVAQEKNHTDFPSEIQVTREFLLAGKLHRAVTFGLDVPSLLFADALGKECGTGTEKSPQNSNQVLEQRLFHTSMLKECEVDYNRVVAHRLVRALLPRSDSSSQVVLALVVEIFSACVLQPLMNLWIPSFLNELIISAMEKSSATQTNTSDKREGVEAANEVSHNVTNGATEMEHTVTSAAENVSATTMGLTTNAAEELGETLHLGHVADSSWGTNKTNDADSPMMNILPEGSHSLAGDTLNSMHDGATSREGSIEVAESDDFDDKDSNLLGGLLLKLSSIALSELQRYMDFEECRIARLNHQENMVDWDDPACQDAVLRLVLVVEAALLQGRCIYRERMEIDNGGDDGALRKQGDNSLSLLLMEMTSDMDAFERRMKSIGKEKQIPKLEDENSDMEFEPEESEISTLRTLISTWMHTGQLSKAVSLVIQGIKSIFAPYYGDYAFLAVPGNADAFARQLEALEGVDIMVETMAILACPGLDIEAESDLIPSSPTAGPNADDFVEPTEGKGEQKSKSMSFHMAGFSLENPSASNDILAHFGSISTPRYVDFHKNAAFASSLRAERERRMRSWDAQTADETVQTIHRKAAPKADVELHHELHNLSRIFYNGTNVMTMRDAARKSDSDEGRSQSEAGGIHQGKVSLLTVEMVSNRRRIEVPDDDSSFLLRAQVC
jgi:hypothetical protein